MISKAFFEKFFTNFFAFFAKKCFPLSLRSDVCRNEAGKGINRRLNGDLGVVFAVALGVQTCRKSLLIPNGAKDRSCA